MPNRYLLSAALLSLCLLQADARCDESEFSTAAEFYKNRQWEQAAAQFSRLADAASDPDERNRSLFYTAESWLQAREYERAEGIFAQLVSAGAGEFGTLAQFRLGETRHYRGDNAEARKTLAEFLDHYPTHELVLAAQKLLADISLAAGQTEEATAVYQRVIDADGQESVRSAARLSLCRALLLQSRFDEVEIAVAEIQDSTDSRLRFAALMLRGQAQYESDQYATALQSFREAQVCAPAPLEEDKARLAASWALWKLDRCEEIDEELQALTGSRQLQSQVVYLAGMTAYRKQEWATAYQHLHEASTERDTPHHGASLFYCGDCKLRLQQAKEALDCFFQLVDADRDSPWLDDAYWGILRGACQMQNIERFELALAAFRSRCPDSPYLHQLKAMKREQGELPDLTCRLAAEEHSFEEAVRLERDGFFDGALAAYRLFLASAKQSPLRAEAQWRMANLEERHGVSQRAIQHLEQLRSEQPDFDRMPQLLVSLARLYEGAGRNDDRTTILQNVLNDFPESWEAAYAAYTLAAASVDDGNNDHAWRSVQDADETLQHVRGSDTSQLERQVLCLKCLLLSKREGWEDIAALVSNAQDDLGQDPTSVRILYWQAEAEFRLGNFDVAALHFDELAVLTVAVFEPWVSMIDLRRAQIAARSQCWEEVDQLVQKLLHRCPEFEFSYECDYLLGRAHAGQGKMSAAREAYARVLGNPLADGTETAAMAQWMIGETYFHQRSYFLAEAAYTKVLHSSNLPEWQARAALQAGKCAELQEEWERAEEIYSASLNSRDQTSVAQEIKARLRWTTQRLAARNEVLLK